MSEPTREQIKEAFIKTIERWERIVEDVDFFHETECSLCLLEGTADEYVCSQLCPVRLYTELTSCGGTPYGKFFHDKTPANALVELNFLRKVYIWWIEKEEILEIKGNKFYGNEMKEEKKEEWVDVTKNIKAKAHIYADGTALLRLYDDSYRFGYMEGQVRICTDDKAKYKAISGFDFRILKKA